MKIKGENRFKIRAFDNVVRVIQALQEPLEDIIAQDSLLALDGVGEGIANEILEIQRTGTCATRQRLLDEFDPGMLQLIRIQGLGPKKIKKLYEELGVCSLETLREALEQEKIRELSGFGKKSEEKLLQELERLEQHAGRTPLPLARRIAESMRDKLAALDGVQRINIAGSLRRGRETIGDIDLLVASTNPTPIMETVCAMPEVEEVIATGDKKTSVRLVQGGIQVDVRVVAPEVFGSALHYFTGSKEHHIKLRTRAKRAGLKISEYGVFRDGETDPIASNTEEDVFAALGLSYIPPELREGLGEIESAEEQNLPELVQLEDVRGDLHMHTTYSDGKATILQMAQAAKELGYDYIVITDHSGSLSVANGMSPRRFAEQIAAIQDANAEIEDFRILSGIEVDILKEGVLDMDHELLRECDWVVGSVHQYMNQTHEEMTDRLLQAIDTGLISCLGHPTGRILGGRDGYTYDMDAILVACRDKRVAVEINGSPGRLDFNAHTARLAHNMGVPIVLTSDAHSPKGLLAMKYAVQQARRGWFRAEDILNTQSADVLLSSVR